MIPHLLKHFLKPLHLYTHTSCLTPTDTNSNDPVLKNRHRGLSTCDRSPPATKTDEQRLQSHISAACGRKRDLASQGHISSAIVSRSGALLRVSLFFFFLILWELRRVQTPTPHGHFSPWLYRANHYIVENSPPDNTTRTTKHELEYEHQ